MHLPDENHSILVGSKTEGGTYYECRPGEGRNASIAWDVQPGGALANPRVIFGGEAPAIWSGLPAL